MSTVQDHLKCITPLSKYQDVVAGGYEEGFFKNRIFLQKNKVISDFYYYYYLFGLN